jgi:hypothetical protein
MEISGMRHAPTRPQPTVVAGEFSHCEAMRHHAHALLPSCASRPASRVHVIAMREHAPATRRAAGDPRRLRRAFI